LTNLAQLLAQGVLFRRQRHEFFMKELLLQLLVVVIDERTDSRVDLDVLRHGFEVAVLHLCDLPTDAPHFGLTLDDLRVQDTVIVALDALRNDVGHQSDQDGGYDKKTNIALDGSGNIRQDSWSHSGCTSIPRSLVEPLRHRIATSTV
jgi:hypothetical protein